MPPRSVKFTLKGIPNAKRVLRQAETTIRESSQTQLRAEAEAVLQDSKENYVPVDEGNLRESGRITGKNNSISIIFGNASAPYALTIHEHPSRHSPQSWRNIRDSSGRFRSVQFTTGGPKYLELPLMAAQRNIGTNIAKAIKSKLT